VTLDREQHPRFAIRLAIHASLTRSHTISVSDRKVSDGASLYMSGGSPRGASGIAADLLRSTLPRVNRTCGGIFACVVLVIVGSSRADGQERQLNQGHPVRLDDALPITAGDATLLGDGTLRLQHEGAHRGEFALDAQYAILPNTLVSVGTVLTTAPHQTSDPGSGDLTFAGRINFGQQSDLLPTMATQVAVTLPTGVDSRATDIELKGLATRSETLGLMTFLFHLNAAAVFRATHQADDDRTIRYRLVVGASLPLPQEATTTVVFDLFAEQGIRRGERETIGAELGIRHRLTPRVAIGAAIGSEFWGPRDRSPFYATAGISFDFELPAFGRGP
jgi:hypothetical protein